MAYELLRVGTTTTFEILNTATGTVEFRGELVAVNKEFSRLSLAARPAAKPSNKMSKREERRQAGQRV